MESQISDIQRTKWALQLNQIDTKAIGSDLGKTDRFFSASGRIDIPRVKAEIWESSQTSNNNKIIDSLEFRANRSGQYCIDQLNTKPEVKNTDSLSNRDVNIEEFLEMNESF